MARCRVFDVVQKRCRHPEAGKEADFYALETGDWVNTLAITDAGEAILVEQYRFGAETLSMEVPGGMINAGEDPVEAGLRELREETGYTASQASLLGRVRPNPAIQSNACHFVLAKGARLTESLDWDEHEELRLVLAPLAEAYAWALEGSIEHALTLNALFLFYPEWRRMRARARPEAPPRPVPQPPEGG